MLKKIGISTLALVAMLIMFSPAQAQAGVRFGVAIGTPPVYAYPADPYAYPVPYAYPYDYYAVPPTYVYPGFGFSYGYRDHDRHEFREHCDHELREHESRRHDFRGYDYVVHRPASL